MRFPSFQQNFQGKLTDQVLKLVDQQLLHFVNLADDFDQSLPRSPLKTSLGWAINKLKPYLRSTGIRVRILSETEVEVFVPKWERNLGVFGSIDEGIVVSAASFAFRSLWRRNRPKGDFHFLVKKMDLNVITKFDSDLILRWELPVLQREALFSQLRSKDSVEFQTQVLIKDVDEMLRGEIEIHAIVSILPLLEWNPS